MEPQPLVNLLLVEDDQRLADLTLCKRIVEAHGGEITLAPNAPTGLVVRVALGTSESQELPGGPAPPADPVTSRL